MSQTMFQDEIDEAIWTAVTGERKTDLPTGGLGFLSNEAIARKMDREANIFKRRLIRFLGEMPEEWDIPELLSALENDREPEVGDEGLGFGESS